MYIKNKKFKIATILGIITSAIALFTAIQGLVTVSIMENFFVLFDEMMNVVVDPSTGMTYLEVIEQTGVISVDEFRTVIYIIVLAMFVILLVVSIASLFVSIFSIKDGSLNRQEFQKKNVKHIFFVVFMGLLAFSIAGDIVSILSLIAFILALIDIVNNHKVLKLHNVSENENFYDNAGEENFFDYKKNPIPEERKEEVVEISQEDIIKQEEKKQKLEETFELLSKLEKSYKNGEIDEETYKRMKATIMDNLNN